MLANNADITVKLTNLLFVILKRSSFGNVSILVYVNMNFDILNNSSYIRCNILNYNP